jgi:hypothetical protein
MELVPGAEVYCAKVEGFVIFRNVGVIGGVTQRPICKVGTQYCAFVPRSDGISEYDFDGVRYQLRQ